MQRYPTAIFQQVNFKTLDELEEKSDVWDVQFTQVEPGEINVDVVRGFSQTLVLSQSSFDRQIVVNGGTPRGYKVFSIPSRPQKTYISRGRKVPHNSIVVSGEAAEVSGTFYRGYNAFTLCIPLEELEQMSLMSGLDLEAITRSGAILSPAPEALSQLRRMLWDICEMGCSGQCLDWFHAAEKMIKSTLTSCLATTVGQDSLPSLNKRGKALREVMDHIRHNLEQVHSLKELCEVGKVSERTLLYAFREHLDVTPMAYLRSLKLRKVFQDLMFGRVRNVTDAATKWGFWHMGQFAADYKRQFGELPSKTFRDGVSRFGNDFQLASPVSFSER